MNKQTSDKPGKLYAFIKQYIDENHHAPSFREMADAIGTSSTNVATYNLKKLVSAGLVEYTPNTARTVRLAKKEPE